MNQDQPNTLSQILNEQQLAESQSRALLAAFGAPFEAAGEILSTYQNVEVKDEADSATMKQARTMRLALKQTRVDVEHRRKDLKADIVKQGRAIDSVARFVKDVIEPAEKYLEAQEKYAEIKAAERAAALLTTRQEALSPYVTNLSVFNLSTMSDGEFNALLETSVVAHQAELDRQRQAAEEAERARLDRERENERIRQENLVLQRQAAEERRKREELEAAQRREAALERQRLAAEELEAKRQSNSPDQEKILRFADELEVIRTQKLPRVATAEGAAVVRRIDVLFSTLHAELVEAASKLKAGDA